MLHLQTSTFSVLVRALQPLTLKERRTFMVRSLRVLLDLPNLDELPTECLTELVFSSIEGAGAHEQLMLQNIFTHVSHCIRGVWR